MRETNSSSRFSTCSASIVPMRRHQHGNLTQLVIVEHAPDLGAVVFAEREQQNRRALRSAQRALGRRRMRRRAGKLAKALAISLCAVSCCLASCFADVRMRAWLIRRRRCRSAMTDDGNGFAGVFVGELADLLHGLGVDLALDLGDVDHLRRLARSRRPWRPWRHRRLRRLWRRPLPAASLRRRWTAMPQSALSGRDDAADQRAHHQQQHDETEHAHHQHFDRCS